MSMLCLGPSEIKKIISTAFHLTPCSLMIEVVTSARSTRGKPGTKPGTVNRFTGFQGETGTGDALGAVDSQEFTVYSKNRRLERIKKAHFQLSTVNFLRIPRDNLARTQD
jgi:hypothetical protein